MNKEIEKYINEKVEEFRKQLIEEAKKLVEEQKKEDEFPKLGDRVWVLWSTGKVSLEKFDDSYSVELETGNIFKTQEEAEFEKEKRKVITELKKFAEPKDREWDGTDGTIFHYFVIFDYAFGKIKVGAYAFNRHSDIYFESEEKAQEAIEAVGEQRIKRFYLEVEE